jgi:aspartyl-tRNA(Asn)/glutamyl-tRNA(Gln) amidotransferase subunit B
MAEKGETVVQETRSFDAVNGTTFSMRSKELAHDYRYFPEPDLPRVVLTEEQIEVIRKAMPSLPRQLVARYTGELGLKEYDALQLTADKEIAEWFESLIRHTSNYKAAANWVLGPVRAFLNERAIDISTFPVTPEQVASIIALVESGKLSASAAAEKILPVMADRPGSMAQDIASEFNLIQDADTGAIEVIAREVLQAWPDKVEAFKAGNKGMLGLFMGELMKKSGGKANPKVASEIIQKLLQE